MDEKTAKELVKTRKAVKKKFQSLKADIIQSQFERERELEPLIRPLKELLTSRLKYEKEEVKDEPLENMSFLTNIPDFSSTPRRQEKPSTYKNFLLPMDVPFLENEEIFEGTPINLSNESDEEVRRELQESIEFLQNLPTNDEYKSYLENFDPLPRSYVDKAIRDTKRLFDFKYGVRHNVKEGKFYIGDSILNFEGDIIIVKGVKYKGSPGLFELLFKKKPLRYNEKELDEYMDILKRTNAYRRNYKEDEPIHGTALDKYVTIIHPYLVEKEILKEPLRGRTRSFSKPPVTRARAASASVKEYFTRLKKKGGGMMDLSHNTIDFVYFDDPNELVERLKLLLASKMAGHTGHNNEINSIIEELREANIII